MSTTAVRIEEPGSAVAPMGRRLSRPGLRDRRLLAGVLLILVSALLGARLLGTGSEGAAVWVARGDLPAGLALRGADLLPTTADVASGASPYLSAERPVPEGLVLVRDVGAGELVAASALAPASAAAAHRTVAVPVEPFHGAEDLARGDRVDVYVTPSQEGAGPVTPVLLASAAEVVMVDGDDGRFGGGEASGIAVSVPESEVATVVGGIGGGRVDVVRVPGAGS
jgi:hypothetical protein